VAPRYADRQGGYLRIVRAGFRQGDGREKAFIELLALKNSLTQRQKRDEIKAKNRADWKSSWKSPRPKNSRNSRRRKRPRNSAFLRLPPSSRRMHGRLPREAPFVCNNIAAFGP